MRAYIKSNDGLQTNIYIEMASSQSPFSLRQLLLQGVCGTLGGWTWVTFNMPLDYLRTMLQLDKSVTRHFIQGQLDHHGGFFKTFYRGASSIYAFAGMVTVLQFTVFEGTLKLLETTRISQQSKLITAGFMAGMCSSFIDTPTQFVKIHTQVDKSGRKEGAMGKMIRILKEEKLVGLRKIYTGLLYRMLISAPGSVIYYGGFQISLLRLCGEKSREASSTNSIFVSGLVAGLLYNLYAYPIDVIKTNLVTGKSNFANLIKERFWQTKNFRMGMALSLIRGVFADSSCLVVYEKTRQEMERMRFFH